MTDDEVRVLYVCIFYTNLRNKYCKKVEGNYVLMKLYTSIKESYLDIGSMELVISSKQRAMMSIIQVISQPARLYTLHNVFLSPFLASELD